MQGMTHPQATAGFTTEQCIHAAVRGFCDQVRVVRLYGWRAYLLHHVREHLGKWRAGRPGRDFSDAGSRQPQREAWRHGCMDRMGRGGMEWDDGTQGRMNAMGRGGAGWDGMGWDGMDGRTDGWMKGGTEGGTEGWDGMRWDGMAWDGWMDGWHRVSWWYLHGCVGCRHVME